MGRITDKKDERIELRVTEEQKSLIEQAAELNGLSLSSYMLNQALKSARLDIEELHIIRLSSTDRDRFMYALEKPPAAPARLKKAIKKHNL